MRYSLTCLVLLLFGSVPEAFAGGEALTLRINDSKVRPGGLVAVVLRTYASRPAGQGQLCFRGQNMRVAGGDRGAIASPFSTFEGGEVFSSNDDTVITFNFDAAGVLLAEFSSASATINDQDGPLAVLYFQLDPSIVAPASYSLTLDVAETFLLDAEGTPIVLDMRAGVLDVIEIGAPFELSASGDAVAAGGVAELAAATKEFELLSGGQVKFLYAPALLGGTPEVMIDPRYGRSDNVVVEHLPGSTRVTFDSLDATLNEVPGDFVRLRLPIAPGLPIGAFFPLTLDADETFLFDALGSPLMPLALEGATIEIVFEPDIFADGFESGDMSAWM